jgi:hypothetical protein
VFLWGSVPVGAANAAATDDPADWVSRDAVAYLEIATPGDLLDHLYSTDVQSLIAAAPDLRRQLDNQSIRELRQVLEYVGRGVGMSASRLARELTMGGITVSFEAPDRLLVVARARDAELLQKAHGTLLSLAREDAKTKNKPDPVKTEEYLGIIIYRLSEQEAHAVLDRNLVVSNQIELVKRSIERSQDKASEFQPLNGLAQWKARKAAVRPKATAWAYVNLERFRQLNPQAFKGKREDEPGAKLLLGPWFSALQKSDWASLELSADAKQLGLELSLPVPEEAVSGPLKVFRPGQGRGAPALVRPKGMLLSVGLWRDFAAVWEVREQFLPAEAMQGLAQLDSVAGQFFGGRDFATGVLGSIGPDWRVVVVQQDYDHMNPKPDLRLPGLAVLLELQPEDQEFPVRLQAAFQSFMGLINLGAAQQKAPPFLLGSEIFEGVELSKAAFLAPSVAEADKPVEPRFNLSPCAARVGSTFMITTSVDAARAVIHQLKANEPPGEQATEDTLIAAADGAEVARLVEVNRASLVTRNMLEKGNNQQAAEQEIDLLAKALRFLGQARLSINDQGADIHVRLDFELGR